jgi:hypothetical protein
VKARNQPAQKGQDSGPPPPAYGPSPLGVLRWPENDPSIGLACSKPTLREQRALIQIGLAALGVIIGWPAAFNWQPTCGPTGHRNRPPQKKP